MSPENELLAAYSAQATDVSKFRRDVEEIVRSYRHSWDIFSELIQNSVDAVRRQAPAGTSNFIGTLDIKVETQLQKITVSDNGCGLSREALIGALAPGRSFKTVGQDYGYKGYGLTFVLYASSSFYIRSVRDGKASALRVTGAIDWLASGSAEEAELPPVQWLSIDQETAEANGTTVSVTLNCGAYQSKFRALSALDHMFEWAQKPKALEYVLRLRTAVGNAAGIFNRVSTPKINVAATVDTHPPTQIPYLYLLADESEYVSTKYYGEVSEYLQAYEDGSLSREAKYYRGLRHTYTDRRVGSQAPINFNAAVIVCGRTGMSRLASEFGVTAELENYNELLLSTGVQLALGDMPLGISIEDWQSYGHDMARYFVLINADLGLSDQLDSGRKGISRYFATAMVKDLLVCFRNKDLGSGERKISLQRLSQMMTEPDSEGTANITQLAERVDERRRRNAVLAVDSLLKFVPEDENEVVVLFTDLVARGSLPGYEAVVVSQGTMYDAAMRYALPRAHPFFHYSAHPLGLGDLAKRRAEESDEDTYTWKDTKGADWFVVEFKPYVQDLVSNRKQRLEEIDLLICWDYDENWLELHAASIDSVRKDARLLYGVTHRLNYDGSTCDVIVLKAVLDSHGPVPQA